MDQSQKNYIPPLKWQTFDCLYDPILWISGLGRSFKRRVTNIVTFTEQPKTIVDVGCGSGTQLDILHSLYPQSQVIGVDPNTPLLEKLKLQERFKSPQVSLMSAHAESLPFTLNSIDVCFSTLAFHHMNTQVKQLAFREIYRILKPNGFFILTDWGVTRFPLFRHLLIFERQEYLNDHFVGLIPHYAEHAGFTQISATRVKFSGIWTWVFKKLS